MKKTNKTKIIILAFLFVFTGCSVTSNSDVFINEDYYELIDSGETAYVFESGSEYEYHYNLSEESEVIVELVISESGEEIGNILLDDSDLSISKLEGTFGITVESIDDDSLLWTLRKDGEEAKLETYNFLAKQSGTHGSISQEGILSEEEVHVLQEEYDIYAADNERKSSEITYDISVNLNICTR